MPGKFYNSPEVVAWLDPTPPRSAESPLIIQSNDEFRHFFPRWPARYLLLITRSEPERLSISLFDSWGSTIQLNLISLERFGLAGTILLGGSSRIDPDDAQYHPRPSDYSKAWLHERIAPALSARNARALCVRAHFPGADAFFGSIDFGPDTNLGAPYMMRQLAPLKLPDAPGDPIPVLFDAAPIIRDDLRARQDAHTEAELAYLEASLSKPIDVAAAHAAIKERFDGISRKEFELQWALASRFGLSLRQKS